MYGNVYAIDNWYRHRVIQTADIIVCICYGRAYMCGGWPTSPNQLQLVAVWFVGG